MAEIQIGRAIVWGLNGTVAYTGVATTGNEPESLAFEDQVDSHESKDKQGEVIGLRFWNKRKRLTINFYPCSPAGGGAIALAKANVVLPGEGAKVTIAGMDGNVTKGVGGANDPINDTAYIYAGGGSISEGNDHEVKMVLPLVRYPADISTQST